MLVHGIASVLSNGAVQLKVVVCLLELDLILVFVTGRGCELVLDKKHGLD